MNVLVTGAGGFLGRALAAHLVARGHRVTGTSASGATVPGTDRVVPYAFGDPVPPDLFSGIDAVVHNAHDFRRGRGETVIAGTEALAEAAAAAGVPRQVFVSSLAARPDAVTEYGRTKFRMEGWFLERGFPVLRPGTILGPGGLFGRIAGTVLTRPVVPLVDGGRSPMLVVGVPDLVTAIEGTLTRGGGEVFPLYLGEPVGLCDLVERLLALHHRKAALVPLPSALLLRGLVVAEALGLRLPVTSDNLRGLRLSGSGVAPSRLGEFVADPEPVDAVLRRAFPPAG